MKRDILLLTLGVIFLVGTIGGLYFSMRAKWSKETVQEQENISSQNLPSGKLNEYLDGSGFVFRYPEDIKIKSQEISNSSTYTDLKLISEEVLGAISFRVSDSKTKSIEEWLKSRAQVSDIKNIALGGISGQEAKTSNGLLAGVLDSGVLFTIEVDFGGNKDFWQKVYNTLLSTFEFSETAQQGEGGEENSEASAEEVVFEGEEIIE